MKQDIEGYLPQNPQYVLDDNVREEFPLELDFLNAVQSEKLKTKRDAMKFIGRTFTATFPETEYVTRVMDDHEKGAIRGEYCLLVENILPERKRQLEEALEEAKRMKKEAEERYASALQEVATMAAEVKLGTVEQKQTVSDSRFVSSNAYNYRKRGMSYNDSIALAKEMLKLRNKRKFKSPHELSLDECRFIGFWLGDGSVYKSKAGGLKCSLCQSDGTPKLQGWIEDLLEKCGIYYTIYHRDGKDEIIRGKRVHTNGVKVYHLSWGTGGNKQNVPSSLYGLIPYLNKKGTELYWGLSREQFFALMEGLFKADGNHGDNLPYKGSSIIGEHKELFDLLQAIGVCRGYRMMIHETHPAAWGKKILYNISLFDTRFHQCVNERAQSRKVSNKHVWCVTMPKGNIVVRKNGRVIIVGNCLAIGFDYPELDTVILAAPTKSLARYYQQVGRCIRPCKGKKTWVVDLSGSYRRFGKVSDLKIGLEKPNSELWAVFSRGRKLTNTPIL